MAGPVHETRHPIRQRRSRRGLRDRRPRTRRPALPRPRPRLLAREHDVLDRRASARVADARRCASCRSSSRRRCSRSRSRRARPRRSRGRRTGVRLGPVGAAATIGSKLVAGRPAGASRLERKRNSRSVGHRRGGSNAARASSAIAHAAGSRSTSAGSLTRRSSSTSCSVATSSCLEPLRRTSRCCAHVTPCASRPSREYGRRPRHHVPLRRHGDAPISITALRRRRPHELLGRLLGVAPVGDEARVVGPRAPSRAAGEAGEVAHVRQAGHEERRCRRLEAARKPLGTAADVHRRQRCEPPAHPASFSSDDRGLDREAVPVAAEAGHRPGDDGRDHRGGATPRVRTGSRGAARSSARRRPASASAIAYE